MTEKCSAQPLPRPLRHPVCPESVRRDRRLASFVTRSGGTAATPQPHATPKYEQPPTPSRLCHPDRSGRFSPSLAPRERRPRSGGTVATPQPHQKPSARAPARFPLLRHPACPEPVRRDRGNTPTLRNAQIRATTHAFPPLSSRPQWPIFSPARAARASATQWRDRGNTPPAPSPAPVSSSIPPAHQNSGIPLPPKSSRPHQTRTAPGKAQSQSAQLPAPAENSNQYPSSVHTSSFSRHENNNRPHRR